MTVATSFEETEEVDEAFDGLALGFGDALGGEVGIVSGLLEVLVDCSKR